ncbi:MAG: hypothetical protein IKM59_01635, partial [Oscillospiraceae bacterium]|nr:hypothetical protein [Oscillospiraceae bacterium]
MSRKYRLLAVLVLLSLAISLFAGLPVFAAVPDTLVLADVTGAAAQVASAIETGITAGNQDVNGIYYNVSYPASVRVGEFEIDTEDYILMAARAISTISGGKIDEQAIPYTDISLVRTTSENGTGTSLNMLQYVELADRVARYGTTMKQLPGSFNRPTDGVNVYEGRITLYSIGHLFAEVLAAYNSTMVLPETVSFLPVHMGDVEVTPTEPAPSAPADWFAAVIDVSVDVKASMVEKNILPGTIYVGPVAVTPAQYVYLASKVVYALYNGQTSGELTVPTLNEPENPQGTVKARIYLYDYSDMARRTAKFADDNGQPPNYTSSSDYGAIHYYAVIETMARALAYYKNNGDLPNYVDLSGFSGTVEEVTTPTTAPTTAPTSVPTNPTSVPGSSSEPVVTDDWYANVISAAIAVETYVKEKGVLPATITVGTTNCTYAQYTYLACQVILGLNNGQTSGELSVPSTKEPANPSETLKAGTFAKTEYLDLAGRSIKFMDNNGGLAANYMITSLGNMHHHGALHMYARILSYYAANGKLPDSIAVTTWAATMASVPGAATFGNDFSAYASFLVPTANCPSTNATIISIGKTAMYYSKGAQGGFTDPKTTYEAM